MKNPRGGGEGEGAWGSNGADSGGGGGSIREDKKNTINFFVFSGPKNKINFQLCISL